MPLAHMKETNLLVSKFRLTEDELRGRSCFSGWLPDLFELFAGPVGLVGLGKTADDFFQDKFGVGGVLHFQEGDSLPE